MLGSPPPGFSTPTGNHQYNSLVGSSLLGQQQAGMTPGPQLQDGLSGIDPAQLQLLIKALAGGAQ